MARAAAMLICATALLPAVSNAEPAEVQALAVVAGLSGSASVATPPAMKTEPARLFAWLPAGATIEVGPGSRVTLAFLDGSRCELLERSRGRVRAGGLDSVSGSQRVLDRVPPLPHLAAIAREAEPGTQSAAIRIRAGERIRQLYPAGGAMSLADSTVLRFSPVHEAAGYVVEVEDEMGRTVFQAQTQAPSVAVSGGILKPGSSYYWRVRTLEAIGPARRGEARFATLAGEDTRLRAALREALEPKGEVESLALLAEVDRRLGLLSEAREGLRAALARAPEDESLRQALAAVEKQLPAEDDGTE